jgi:hypothetical protein
MRLYIAPTRFIRDIQSEFNREFAFLKLEFFSKKALLHADYSSSQLMPANGRIGDIQLALTDGDLEINGKMKVVELEKRLKEQFNVAAQVFRRSGNIWLETTMTDSWSLEQQNNHGREISVPPLREFNRNDPF